MTIRCAVKGCHSVYRKGCDVHFFLFPKNQELLKQWIALIRRNDWKPSTASRVCHLHFRSSDFIETPGIKRKMLKNNIIPTINMGYDEGTENDLLNDLSEAIQTEYEISKSQQQVDVLPISETIKISTSSENIMRQQESIDNQSTLIAINMNMEQGTSVKNRKHKACSHECHEYSTKIKKLEEENVRLQQLQQEQNEKHAEELKKQAETFHIILQKEKEAMQKKLDTSNLKSKLLVRKIKRRNNKIKILINLLEVLKGKGLIKETVFNVLQNEFSDTILPIIQNEHSNKGKSTGVRRHTEDIKKFAAT